MLPVSEHLRAKLDALPSAPGCYIFKDVTGAEVYVGKAKNLRSRVRSYFQAGTEHAPLKRQLMMEVSDLDTVEVESEVEALLLENQLIKELQPRFNVRLKDSKDYPLLAITREEFPRLFLTRDRGLKDVDYYGPFGSMTSLRQAYHFLMRAFQFRNCDLDIREDDPKRRYFKPCLNYHVKLCSAPCTTRIDGERYRADIKRLRSFLSGRGKKAVVQQLAKDMQAASNELRFEEAAKYRDQLKSIERLKERGNLKELEHWTEPLVSAGAGVGALHKIFALEAPPRVIEGFDLAHLMGNQVVASMVQFHDGQPHKEGYRRFKIRANVEGGAGNDDFAGMEEVVRRRYERVKREGSAIPDIVLIDGGHGQVGRAAAVLRELDLRIPVLVGLAKREETLILPDGQEQVLSRRNAGLKLLQHVRDEAHRFCRRYHHLLRKKGFEESG